MYVGTYVYGEVRRSIAAKVQYREQHHTTPHESFCQVMMRLTQSICSVTQSYPLPAGIPFLFDAKEFEAGLCMSETPHSC